MKSTTVWVLANTKAEYSDINNRMYLNYTGDIFDMGSISHTHLIKCATREVARNLARGFFNLTPKKLTLIVEV